VPASGACDLDVDAAIPEASLRVQEMPGAGAGDALTLTATDG
jgi:hypothetical protein